MPGEPPPVGPFRIPASAANLDTDTRCVALRALEVGEGTESMYADPFCQIRNCTVASASDDSPFITADTTWICPSTATCRDGFCDLSPRHPW